MYHKLVLSQIYTNFPAGDSSLFHYLNILRMRHGNNVSISHLINFRIDSFHSLSNLSALLQILPFTMSSNIRYTPYFVYSRAGHTDFQSQLFPYYLITDDSVLLCSGDFSKHIVLKDHEAVTAYINAFDHALKQAHLLIRSINDPMDAWQHLSGDRCNQRYGSLRHRAADLLYRPHGSQDLHAFPG